MATLAGTSDGLNFDEWCYFYSQASGSDCPVDPGAIDYAAAGINGDRTTPISISTWLSVMQAQAPELGLSGLGDVSSTPGWGVLLAAGLALVLMGGLK
jgi:hypothetical protein